MKKTSLVLIIITIVFAMLVDCRKQSLLKSTSAIKSNLIQADEKVNDNLYIGEGVTKAGSDKILVAVATSRKFPSISITPVNLHCNISSVKYIEKAISNTAYVVVTVNNALYNENSLNFVKFALDKKKLAKANRLTVQFLWKGYISRQIDASISLTK